MKPVDREELFRRMAAEYVRQEGQALHRERAELEEQGIFYAAPGMDERVRRETGRKKHPHRWSGLGLLAACLVLFLLVPQLLDTTRREMRSAGEAGDGEPETALQEEQEDAADDAATDRDAGAAGLIPLAFDLPAQFTVADAELDNGTSIYYLEDAYFDDVVLTMQWKEEAPVYGGLVELSINGREAYASSGPDYSLLAFEKGDIVYRMTCKYDINTLVALGSRIL